MLSNLSFRYKAPFSLAAAILLTAAAVSGWLTVQDFQESRDDVREQVARLGATLAYSIRHTLVHDDVWQTYQIIRFPGMGMADAADDEELLVLDSGQPGVLLQPPAALPGAERAGHGRRPLRASAAISRAVVARGYTLPWMISCRAGLCRWCR